MLRLLCLAYLELLRLEPALLRQNFARIHDAVRRTTTASVARGSEIEPRIVRAVDLACVFYPKEVLCLQRSAAATCLLRKQGIPAELAIGVESLPFRAHAWVEVGGEIVNDKPSVAQIYTVLARF